MVEVRIRNTGGILEAQDAEITYIKTAGDLGEITKINSSYSWVMKFPKTPKNTAELDGLGLVGSGSRKPYEKIYCDLTDNGFPVVVKGLLNVKETSEYYDIFIQEGFIDFIKDIQNDNVSDVGINDLDHVRTYENIVNSFSLNNPYAYLVGDVNGAYLPNINGTTNLDPRYMAPFANIGYIWDRIFNRYGWDYEVSGEVLQSIRDTWISYPSDIEITNAEITNAGELFGEEVIGEFQNERYNDRRYKIPLPDRDLNNDYMLPQAVGDINFVIQQDGNYDISIFSEGMLNILTVRGSVTRGFNVGIWIGDDFIPYNRIAGENNDGTVVNFQRSLITGDVISLGVVADVSEVDGVLQYIMDITSAGMEINYLNPDFDQGEVSFTKALIDLKVADFIKEVMVRESLTAFTDNENRTIKFLTLEQRFEQEVINWTNKYGRRTSETYLYNSYAQNNLIKHKYDDDVSNHSDGNLFVDNANLDNEETLYTSLSHAPGRELSIFSDNGQNYNVPRTRMFEVEVSEEDGNLVGTYKFLKDRFFFVKSRQVDRSIYVDDNLINGFPLVSTHDTTFNNIVTDKYGSFLNISLQSKVHKIDLALGLSDIIGLKLYDIYYFEQEASYYFLNQLKYKKGNITSGEFLRITPNQKLRAFSDGFSNAFNI